MSHTMELTYRNGYLIAQARQILIMIHKSKHKGSDYKILGFHIFLRDPFRRTFFGSPGFISFKNLCPGVLPNSLRDAQCPG
jgi:hypothetical protein